MKKYLIRRWNKNGEEIRKIVTVRFTVECPTMFTGSDGHLWEFIEEVK